MFFYVNCRSGARTELNCVSVPPPLADVWDALNYGQVVYAIKTRSGQVYLKLKKNYGDMSALEVRPFSSRLWAF
jgi:hypothetical protein